MIRAWICKLLGVPTREEVQWVHDELERLNERFRIQGGTVTSISNSAAAANSRCERIETRIHKLEHHNGIEY